MKENDIRPKNIFAQYTDMGEKDALLLDQSDSTDIPCPACASDSKNRVFSKWGFEYALCGNCRTLYQSPRPSEKAFAEFYQKSPFLKYWAKTIFPAIAIKRKATLFKDKADDIIELCKTTGFKPDCVADIGAGYGLFLEVWKERYPETKLFAVEPNPDHAQVCRDKNFIVSECFAEQAEELNDKIDLAVSFEVIEHVIDPYGFCQSIKKLLRKNGRIVLTGLAVDGFDIQVLGKNSKSIFPPHHINFISVKGFQLLLERVGFSNINVFTPGKLDVDIVKNAYEDNQDLLSDNRFVRSLLESDSKTRASFQDFLKTNNLSSHCWAYAQYV